MDLLPRGFPLSHNTHSDTIRDYLEQQKHGWRALAHGKEFTILAKRLGDFALGTPGKKEDLQFPSYEYIVTYEMWIVELGV